MHSGFQGSDKTHRDTRAHGRVWSVRNRQRIRWHRWRDRARKKKRDSKAVSTAVWVAQSHVSLYCNLFPNADSLFDFCALWWSGRRTVAEVVTQTTWQRFYWQSKDRARTLNLTFRSCRTIPHMKHHTGLNRVFFFVASSKDRGAPLHPHPF